MVPPIPKEDEAAKKKAHVMKADLPDAANNAEKPSDVAVRNKSESPLLNLPAEIRNMIYGYVLGGRIFDMQWDYDTAQMQIDNRERNAHALLRVSRQCYQETAPLIFELNVFSYASIRSCFDARRFDKLSFLHQIVHFQCEIFYIKIKNISSGFSVSLIRPKFEEPNKCNFYGLLGMTSIRDVHIMVAASDESGEDHQSFLAQVAEHMRKIQDIVQAGNPGIKVTCGQPLELRSY